MVHYFIFKQEVEGTTYYKVRFHKQARYMDACLGSLASLTKKYGADNVSVKNMGGDQFSVVNSFEMEPPGYEWVQDKWVWVTEACLKSFVQHNELDNLVRGSTYVHQRSKLLEFFAEEELINAPKMEFECLDRLSNEPERTLPAKPNHQKVESLPAAPAAPARYNASDKFGW